MTSSSGTPFGSVNVTVDGTSFSGTLDVAGQFVFSRNLAAGSDAISANYVGTFTVTVTIGDDDGGSVTTNFQVTVQNVAPRVFFTNNPVTILEGASASQSVVVANRPPTGAVFEPAQRDDVYRAGQTVVVYIAFADGGKLDTHTCSAAWGDGSSSAGTIRTHVYGDVTATLPVTIVATVTDDDGGAVSLTVQINISPKKGKGNGSPHFLSYRGKPKTAAPVRPKSPQTRPVKKLRAAKKRATRVTPRPRPRWRGIYGSFGRKDRPFGLLRVLSRGETLDSFGP